MFFVAKDKIGTTLGAQKEYAACERRGIRFVSTGNVWHYLWPAEMMEPSIKERFAEQPTQEQIDGAMHSEPDHFIWSQEVGPGEVVGEPVINPFSGSNPDWITEAKAKYAEEQQRRATVQ